MSPYAYRTIVEKNKQEKNENVSLFLMGSWSNTGMPMNNLDLDMFQSRKVTRVAPLPGNVFSLLITQSLYIAYMSLGTTALFSWTQVPADKPRPQLCVQWTMASTNICKSLCRWGTHLPTSESRCRCQTLRFHDSSVTITIAQFTLLCKHSL